MRVFQTSGVVKTPQTKTKSWCCNVPAEQGDLKTQGKLSSQVLVAAKYRTLCVAVPKAEAKTQKYRVSFFQGHNSPAKTFQIWLSEERQTEAASAAAQHPPAQKLRQQPADPVLSHRDTLTPGKSGQSFISSHLITQKNGLCGYSFSPTAIAKKIQVVLYSPGSLHRYTRTSTCEPYNGQDGHFTTHLSRGCPRNLNSAIS